MDFLVVSENVAVLASSTTTTTAAAIATTTSTPDGSNDLAIAWICTVVACLGFGSNYLPVKKCDTRDGQFFSLMVACGIFLVGFIQWLAFGLYKFEPIAMLGGVIWATGNLFVPIIVQRLGLGVGQLVWGATNMLTGWATGMFGLFGVDKAPMSGDAPKPEEVNITGEEPTTQGSSSQFLIGFVVALGAGVLFGSNFDPPTVLQQQGKACADDPTIADKSTCHSQDSLDYVISHFTGVLLLTIVAFVVFKLAAPSCYIGKDVVLPGLIAGILWGIAQVCWFKANAVLSYVIAFPIIVGIPGVIAAMWGVVLFGENKGRKNMICLSIIIVLQAISLILIATSKGNA
ncbi:hypothetical protein EMIHUDRAFT_252101 [Emiliania huxleyi CCMP1516]|uniref:Transmembrane protein 144 n=2 Tax=Emiliania huxleyi TaxID=2903 RepID=A0A0D3KNV6_EMIH1|nr:hypothetical protein EMIHUDRAFT_252101 [Emiliania huxleyi CCMP1516]EOD37441.1 hypothetical protein EMIHUDRAFT_252101 [Emiliania huxleyi CCMP1516]|eukprot:XP_005789870.1 hypothetical protein EMIHUDRAFT_252101 [Emiliania huxleyi CCMP1516]